MKFLVIGSNSFSGSNFINFLINKDCEVLGISRSKEIDSVFLPYKWGNLARSENLKNKFDFHQIDLNKDLVKLMKLIDNFRPEYVINFAAQGMVAESWLNPTHWYKTNLLSQVALHDELRKKTFLKKYIHVTTPEVYGDTPDWIKENYNFSPSTPYAVSRAACDLHLLSYFKAYNFPVIFTRAANVYGPGQQLYRIIPRSFLSALTGKKLDLHGGGISIRSFIHINDVADATFKLALNANPGSSWHLSTNESISIIDLVKKIFKIVGSDFDKIVKIGDDRLGKDQSYLLDSQSIRDEFSWKDKISIEEGLDETFLWIKDNLSILRNLSWNYTHKK